MVGRYGRGGSLKEMLGEMLPKKQLVLGFLLSLSCFFKQNHVCSLKSVEELRVRLHGGQKVYPTTLADTI